MATEDISKIVREISAFQAEYIKLSPEYRPVGCTLPPDGPDVPDLPAVDLPDITKACSPTFIEFPLVVEPFVPPESCIDGLSFTQGSGIIQSSTGGPTTGSFSISINQDPVDFCDYKIEIPPLVIPCHPAGPSFAGAARINVIDLNSSTSQAVDIKLTRDEDLPCRWVLDGTVDIVIPEVPCPSGISFNPGTLSIVSTCPIVPRQQRTVQINRTTNSCEYDILLPELKIPCYPDGPKVHGDVTVKLKDRGVEFSSQKASIAPNTSVGCCDFKLDGDIIIPIPCHTGVVFNESPFVISPEPLTPESFLANKTLKISRHVTNGIEDICTFDIDFPDIVIPCFPNGIQYEGAITFSTIDGLISSSIDLNAARDPGIPCKFDLAPINIELPVPACPSGISFNTNIVIKANAGTTIPDTSDTEGKRRYHNLSLQNNPDGLDGRDCGATLSGELNLGLPDFVTQCTTMGVGPKNSVTFTFDPSKSTPSVIGLKTIDDGCGFEFTGLDVNLPVLACDADHSYAVTSDFNVYVGAQKLGPSQNSIILRPKYWDSIHCGLTLEGELHFPDVTSGSFNYTAWKLQPSDASEAYAPGTVASMVFPEGGRCAYRVIAPEGAAANIVPTAPEAKGVWEGLGCMDEKQFHPFKVIKTRGVTTAMKTVNPDTVVKVVPNSYLYKDVQADASLQVKGLDTPFYLDPGQNVYLEVTFDASGNEIKFSHSSIAVGNHWDDDVISTVANGEDALGIFAQLFKCVKAKQALAILNTSYCSNQIQKYVGLSHVPTQTEPISEFDLLNIYQLEILNKLSNLKDSRCRQFKAYILIASAEEGKVKEAPPTDPNVHDVDVHETNDVQLKKEGRTYNVIQAVKTHLILVAKNVANVPLVLIEPFTLKSTNKITRLPIPTITVTPQDLEVDIAFSMPPLVDVFGESREIGINSGDIHIYFTIDGSVATINTEENTNSRMYEGSAMRFNLEDITGPIMYMAVSPTFLRSFSRSYEI